MIYYGTAEKLATRSTSSQEARKLPLSTVEMIEKTELMKSRQLKLKRNTGDKRKKSYNEDNVEAEKGRDLEDEKGFESRGFDDELDDREYQSKRERKGELYKKVLEELEDMMEQRDLGYREEKRGRDAAQELLEEINRALDNKK